MRNQYIIEIRKDGYMKYISHLDMIKLFKNSFKKAGIKLAYSQGFNPHPKMGFAQPLSLGYSSSCEILEFETKDVFQPTEILERLQCSVPKGIEIFNCDKFTNKKSFAARTYAATYEITIPIKENFFQESDCKNKSAQELCEAFMKQEKIVALKRQKKTGTNVEVDIKGMVRSLKATIVEDSKERLVLTATLDSGSNSNLSPELVFVAFAAFAGIDIEREDVEIKRTELFFT